MFVLILALGLGLRLDYAISPNNEPNFDSRAYAGIAAGIYKHHDFEQLPSPEQPVTQPASNYSPGVPLLAGGIYLVTGGVHLTLARALLAVISAVAMLLAFLLGRRWAGPDAGLVAAAAVAVYPASLEYAGMLTPEPLAATLLAAAVLTTAWAFERDSPLLWAVPGVLLGATTILRPEYLLVGAAVGLLVGIFVGRRDTRRSGLVAGAVLACGVAVAVAPWTIRNAIALDRFVPVSTGGGQVLFAGTYLPSDGNPQRVKSELQARDPALRRRLKEIRRSRDGGRTYLEEALAELARQRHPDLSPDVALTRMGREQLRDDITEHTGEYAVFVLRKISRIWLQGPRGVMQRPVWAIFHLLIVAGALAGLSILFRRRPREAWLVVLLVLAATLISALLVASPRRTLVLLPLLAALAGAAAVWAAEELQRRRAAA